MIRTAGGCTCGKVRIEASGQPYRVGLSHRPDFRGSPVFGRSGDGTELNPGSVDASDQVTPTYELTPRRAAQPTSFRIRHAHQYRPPALVLRHRAACAGGRPARGPVRACRGGLLAQGMGRDQAPAWQAAGAPPGPSPARPAGLAAHSGARAAVLLSTSGTRPHSVGAGRLAVAGPPTSISS